MSKELVKELENIKEFNIGVLCTTMEEAKELFTFPFPYEVRDLSRENFKSYLTYRDGVVFFMNDAPYNTYSSMRYALDEGLETIRFATLIKLKDGESIKQSLTPNKVTAMKAVKTQVVKMTRPKNRPESEQTTIEREVTVVTLITNEGDIKSEY